MSTQDQTKRNLWTPELTTSRENVLNVLINQAQTSQKKKRKREAQEPQRGTTTTTITQTDAQAEKVAVQESGARITEYKRVEVGKWEVTKEDSDTAKESVKAYKQANISTGKTAAARKAGVGGGSATGWYPGDLQERIVRSYQGARVNQILVELSTALFEQAKKKVAGEQEVECLYIGSDQLLLISSNAAGSAEPLRDSILNFKGLVYTDRKGLFDAEKILTKNAMDKLLQEDRPKRKIMEAAGSLNEYLAKNPDVYKGKGEAEVIQALRINNDTKGYVEDIYSWLEYQEIAERLRQLEAEKVKVADPDAAAGILSGMKEGVLIVENTFDPLHAELTLLYTYIKSGRSNPAQVYGRKRPCQGCYATLAYAKGLNYQLEYNPNPGNWFEANVGAAIAYYGGLTIPGQLTDPEELKILHEEFKDLSEDKKKVILNRYALQPAYATVVDVPGKGKQTTRGLTTPPNSPVHDPTDPSQVDLVTKYHDLMDVDAGEQEKKDQSEKQHD